MPLTHTVASWSTAPKCTSTRCPAQAAGISTSRRYHTACRKSVFSIPEACDSGANGTRISPASSRSTRPRSRPESPWSISNCHAPLRFNHSERTICGRGYSGRGHVSGIAHSLCASWVSGAGQQPAPEEVGGVDLLLHSGEGHRLELRHCGRVAATAGIEPDPRGRVRRKRPGRAPAPGLSVGGGGAAVAQLPGLRIHRVVQPQPHRGRGRTAEVCTPVESFASAHLLAELHLSGPLQGH